MSTKILTSTVYTQAVVQHDMEIEFDEQEWDRLITLWKKENQGEVDLDNNSHLNELLTIARENVIGEETHFTDEILYHTSLGEIQEGSFQYIEY